MALRQQQQLKQQQKLSPMQMQVIRLTELPILEFEEKITQELEENPALEEGNEYPDDVQTDGDTKDFDEGSNISQEDIALGDYINDEEIPDYHLPSSRKELMPEIPFAGGITLQEHLLAQLNEIELSEEDKEIGRYIIGSIDRNGYLDRNIQAISDDLIFQQNIEVTTSRLETILHQIQELDPAGIAARSLQECLLLQLKRYKTSEVVNLALEIIENYFDEFTKKHYERIIKALNIDEDKLKEVMQEILSLNPKPGNNWNDIMSTNLTIINPDFLVESVNGDIYMSLNSRNVPPLRVSREYSDMLRGYSDNKKALNGESKNAIQFVKQKLDAAKWFIDAVKQRQETMERTMQAIVDLQYDFFLSEDEIDLKPMILKDVADITGYDISTVSRVTNSKYVQANQKIYPLKYFFSESMQTDTGEEISSREVKKILQDCILQENKKKPLTDDRLTEILKEKGYVIARRTVAKYREQLNIPIARLRKEI